MSAIEPACRTELGEPLWLTGEVSHPQYGEWYWTPAGPKQRQTYAGGRAWPTLTKEPVMQHPYLAGKIDQALKDSAHSALSMRELLKECRPLLWRR